MPAEHVDVLLRERLSQGLRVHMSRLASDPGDSFADASDRSFETALSFAVRQGALVNSNAGLHSL